MTTQQFIEKAIEGGYKKFYAMQLAKDGNWEMLFIDPTAWQAVGKVEGWGLSDYYEPYVTPNDTIKDRVPYWKM